MAADCVADGDYLGEYSRFFAEFVARVNPDDQLPVKVSVYDVNESELVGEIISVTLQYLNRIYCPPSLQSYIARLVIQAIKSTCKKQPEICGLRQQEKTYAPLKLMQAVTNEVNEICRRYLDNSRLALLPPPSSTPQVTVGAIRNARRKMEDRHMILHDLNTMFNIQDDTIVDYYAVFDGHGGQDAAAYCATHLHQYLVESVHYPTDPESALRDAFLTTDAQFIAKSSTQKLNGGTTAVCALLINKKLYIAWVGDSMASLVTYGNVRQLVNPHRPTREDESERIRNMGGIVVHCMGVLRVNGFLSISRAIGDVPYKPYISGEPEVRCVTLDGTEDFLIIACDGLWDYVDQRTAALRVYRQVLQNPYELKHVHQALLQSAKRAGSLDNITVIVVFLTPPIEIASRSSPLLTHQAPNGLLLNNMDPNNPIPSNHDQFDVNKPAYIKQLIDDDVDRPNFDMDLLLKNSVCGMTRNGKHDDDEHEFAFTDVGPETDVDAGEDVHGKNYSALAASSSVEPIPESEKSPMEIEKYSNDDDNGDRNDDYSNRDNANVCPADSVVNDGDVDNRVRPSDRDVRGADVETLRDTGDDDNDDDDGGDGDGVTCVRASPHETARFADMHTVVDDDESPPSPRAAKPLQHALIVADNVADSEDSEDEWNYYRADPKKTAAAATAAVDESLKDIEALIPQKNLESVEVICSEVIQSSKAENDIKCEGTANDISSPELISIDISDEKKSSNSEQSSVDLQEEKKEEQDMDFQLNPEAAEFVPLSPPLLSNRECLKDFAISGSPLKHTQTMDDIPVPSESEFDKEMCHRPKEIEKCFPHEENADLQNNSSHNLDVSEISSTKAEMGDDESMMHIMSTSQWQTDISCQWNEKTQDDAGSEEESDVVVKDNPMAMSLTPGNLMAALEKDVDLNAVHMLDDSSDGAEQANTPPRSPEVPEPLTVIKDQLTEDRTLVEEMGKNPILSTSTPHTTLDDTVSSSNISFDTSYTSSQYKTDSDDSDLLYSYDKIRDPIARKVLHNMPEGPYLPACELDEFEYFKIMEERTIENIDRRSKEKKSSDIGEEKVNESMDSEEKENKITDSEEKENKSLDSEEKENKSLDSEEKVNKSLDSEEKENKIMDSEEKENKSMDSEEKENKSLDFEEVENKSMNSEEEGNKSTDSEEKEKIRSNFITAIESLNWEMCPKPEYEIQCAKLKKDNPQAFSENSGSIELQHKMELNESNQSNNWPDFYETEKAKMLLSQDRECRVFYPFPQTEKKNISEGEFDESHKQVCADEELHSSDLMIQPSVMDLQSQDKLPGDVPIRTMTLTEDTCPVEQVQAEKKDAEFPPSDNDKEKVTSESIPPKQEETEESQKTVEASLEDIATIDKSKEKVSGVATEAVELTKAVANIVGPTKTKTTTTTSAKRPTKTTTTARATTVSTTKTATKSPTSPSKAISAVMRTTSSPAQSTAKKLATSTATRPKQLVDGSAKAAVLSVNGKTTVTKTATAKASTSPRVSAGTKPKTTTTTASSKVNSGTSIEKKSTLSGDAKSVSKSATAKPASATLRTTTTGTTARTTLAKTSTTTAKTSTSSVTSKPRPMSATSAVKITPTSKPSTTGSSRPRTAPTSGGTTKPRESTVKTLTSKSPLIDKQSKETVNKQISRSGASAPKTSGRASAPVGSSTPTGATKARTPSGKSVGNATAISPTKKTLTSKTVSKITPITVTKRVSSGETKIMQNGIPKEDVMKAAVITATSMPEDDVLQKDASPVNVPTDNQLIAD